jgi:hypothetical protein
MRGFVEAVDRKIVILSTSFDLCVLVRKVAAEPSDIL